MLLRVVFALLTTVSLILVELPTSAQTYPPIVLRHLGRYPVIPSVTSTARLRAHRRELLAAAKTIPLTQGEYDALDAELTDPKVLQYGLIPRHLDAMTSGPAPYHALHNVTIPPNQYGWHLTYSHGIHRSDIYIPNACGNVSVVRSIQRMARRRKGTAANHRGVLQPSPLPPTAAPSPSAAPAASATPAAAYTPTPPPKKKKSFFATYWPVLAGIVVMCATQMRIGSFRLCSFGGHGSHGGPSPAPKPSSSSQPGPPPRTPTPAPTSSSQPGPPPHTPTPAPTATAHPTPTPTQLPSPTPGPTMTPRPTMTPYPTPTPMPSWTPMPTPTPKPTCTPKVTPTPSPTPTYCPLKPNRRSAHELPKLLKDAIKAWGALSSPKDWQHLYFNFKLPF